MKKLFIFIGVLFIGTSALADDSNVQLLDSAKSKLLTIDQDALEQQSSKALKEALSQITEVRSRLGLTKLENGLYLPGANTRCATQVAVNQNNSQIIISYVAIPGDKNRCNMNYPERYSCEIQDGDSFCIQLDRDAYSQQKIEILNESSFILHAPESESSTKHTLKLVHFFKSSN